MKILGYDVFHSIAMGDWPVSCACSSVHAASNNGEPADESARVPNDNLFLNEINCAGAKMFPA
jgi:hypothetical protein